MTYNVFGGTLNLAQFNSNSGLLLSAHNSLAEVLLDRHTLSTVRVVYFVIMVRHF